MAAATTFNLAPPPGFQGLRDDLPLTVYYRHQPHWRQQGATYFVTFRLADSLPQSKLHELESIKREWEAKHGTRRRTECHSVPPQGETECGLVGRNVIPSRTEHRSVLQPGKTEWHSVLQEERKSLTRTIMQKVEHWLDQGMGSCYLKRPDASRIVVDCLHHFDDRQYELDCYVVMANHVHAVIRPLESLTQPLEKILQSRKSRMAREINAAVGRSGVLWHDESFDRVIRDEEHLYRCIQYIGRNPRRAGLPRDRWIRWIRPSWIELGWRFEDE